MLRERQARNRRLWDQLRQCFHPDATVSTSWFTGRGSDFVAASQARTDQDRDVSIVLRMSPPTVQQHGPRAVVELSTTTTRFPLIDGVEAELVSYMRLLYRAERRDAEWKLLALTGIFERDTLAAAVPGTLLSIDRKLLAQFRTPYRFLAYQRVRSGGSMPPNLYADDQPDAINALYTDAFTWLKT